MNSYDEAVEELFKACTNLLAYLPKGTEPHGQDMATTMYMGAVRNFRKACGILGLYQHFTAGES